MNKEQRANYERAAIVVAILAVIGVAFLLFSDGHAEEKRYQIEDRGGESQAYYFNDKDDIGTFLNGLSWGGAVGGGDISPTKEDIWNWPNGNTHHVYLRYTDEKTYSYKIDGTTTTEYGIECDGNCLSRNEISKLLKASLKYILFNEGVLNSLETDDELSMQVLKAIKCLDGPDSKCKILNR